MFYFVIKKEFFGNQQFKHITTSLDYALCLCFKNKQNPFSNVNHWQVIEIPEKIRNIDWMNSKYHAVNIESFNVRYIFMYEDKTEKNLVLYDFKDKEVVSDFTELPTTGKYLKVVNYILSLSKDQLKVLYKSKLQKQKWINNFDHIKVELFYYFFPNNTGEMQ